VTRRLGVVGAVAPFLLLLSCGDRQHCTCPTPSSTARCAYVLDYDTPAVMVTPPQPVYPEEARLNGDEGIVHARLGVGSDGRPCGAQITSSDAASLDVATLEAVLKSTWIPARPRGEAVAVELDVPIRFSLSHLRNACSVPNDRSGR